MVEAVHLKSPGGGTASPKVLDKDEYLARYGVSNPLSGVMDDKLRSLTNHQLKTLNKTVKTAQDKYYSERSKRSQEYENLVKSGKVRPRTQAEKAFRTAQGNSENRSVKAARRILTKRGIDWKTGKRIKGFTGHGYPEIDSKTGIEKRR